MQYNAQKIPYACPLHIWMNSTWTTKVFINVYVVTYFLSFLLHMMWIRLYCEKSQSISTLEHTFNLNSCIKTTVSFFICLLNSFISFYGIILFSSWKPDGGWESKGAVFTPLSVFVRGCDSIKTGCTARLAPVILRQQTKLFAFVSFPGGLACWIRSAPVTLSVAQMVPAHSPASL